MVSEREARQIERANAIYRPPVMFIPCLRPWPGWDAWIEIFEAAGYAALTPGWPIAARPLSETHGKPGYDPGGLIGQAADHVASIAARLDRRPAIVGRCSGGLLAETLARVGRPVATVALDAAPTDVLPARRVLQLRSVAPDGDRVWRDVGITALEFVRRHAPRHIDVNVRRLGIGVMSDSAEDDLGKIADRA